MPEEDRRPTNIPRKTTHPWLPRSSLRPWVLIGGGTTRINREVAVVDNRPGPDTPGPVAVDIDLGIDTPWNSSVGQGLQ